MTTPNLKNESLQKMVEQAECILEAGVTMTYDECAYLHKVFTALRDEVMRYQWLDVFYKQWEYELQCAEVCASNNKGESRTKYYDEGVRDGMERVIKALKANMENQ